MIDKEFSKEDKIAKIPGVGTLTYMPPEVLEDGINYSCKSEGCTPKQDIWSLGVIMYNALSAQFPFDEENVKKMKNKIMNCDFGFNQ